MTSTPSKNKAASVWVICSNRWYSAISAFAIESALALSKRGIPTQLTLSSSSKALPFAKKRGLPLSKPLHKGNLLTKTWFLLKLAHSVKPCLILTFNGQESVFARIYGFIFKVKVIRFKGDWNSSSKDTLLLRLLRRTNFLGYDAVVSPNRLIYQHLNRLTLRTPVHLIPYGSDLYTQKDPSPPPRRDLLLIGRLDPVKGHFMALQIFKTFLDSCPLRGDSRPRLVIIGEEANLSGAALRKQIYLLGLKEGVDVLWHNRRIKDLGKEIEKACLGFISSTSSEHICRVAVEYLRCGTPLFVSGAGALEECLYNENSGVSYRGLDVSAAATLLSKVYQKWRIESPSERFARCQSAAERFSNNSLGKRLERLSTDLLRPQGDKERAENSLSNSSTEK